MRNKTQRVVLLLEDNAELRVLFEGMLGRAGFEVVSFENPKAALDARVSFDAVFTDNDMPEMKGVDFVEWLRGQGYTVPVVMVSGSVDPDVPARIASLNALFFEKIDAKRAVAVLEAA